MGTSTCTSKESAERVRAMGDHYASACLGRGRGGVRYRGDVGEREIRAGLRQHIKCFDFCKVRETRNGGDKICGAKNHCRAALRGFLGHRDGAARRKYDQARAGVHRSLSTSIEKDLGADRQIRLAGLAGVTPYDAQYPREIPARFE